NPFDVRIACDSRCGHSSAEADDEYAPWCRMKSCSKMPEQQLSAGVTGGGIGLAIHPEGDAGIGADHGDRIVYSLRTKDEVIGGGDLFNCEVAMIGISIKHCR